MSRYALHAPRVGDRMAYLEMRGITKSFGGLRANDAVDLTVERGEIHALVGENGAGKTTLMRILYGMQRADAGVIRLNGREVRIDGPQQAARQGIGMVHQHFQLAPSLTALENVALGVEPHHGPWLDRHSARRRAQTLGDELDLHIPWDTPVRRLSLGDQQRVETLRLLYRDAQLLIFDEPTTILTPQEVDNLFVVVRRLAASGRSVILITHKLREVLTLAERVTVLRQGRVVAVTPAATATPDDLARLMVGETIVAATRTVSAAAPTPVLEVRDLRTRDRGAAGLRGLTFTIHAGEMLGVAGVEGNGQRELVDSLVGVTPAWGSIMLHGVELIDKPTRVRRRHGLAVIPADRNSDGVCLGLSIAENLVATRFWDRPYARAGVLRTGAIVGHARAIITRFGVQRARPGQPIGALSGGNVQRLVVARELENDPAVLIAAYPTRGVDVRAAEFIRRALLDLRARGHAVMLISEDLSELMQLCDRLVVLFEGRIAGAVPVEEAESRLLGRLMMGEDREDRPAVVTPLSAGEEAPV